MADINELLNRVNQRFPQNRANDLLARVNEAFPQQSLGQRALELGAVPGVALTPEQIQQIQAGQQITPAQPELTGQFQPVQAEPLGQLGSLGRGVVQGGLNIGFGALGALNEGGELAGILGEDKAKEFRDRLEQTIAAERTKTTAQTGENPVSTLVGEIVGEIGSLPLPASLGRSATAKLLSAAGLGGVAGALSAKGRAEDPLSAALISGGISGGIGALGQAGQRIMSQVLAKNRGQITPNLADEIIEIGKREGIDVFAQDIPVIGQALLGKASKLVEDVPLVGTVKGRQRQVLQQGEAASRFTGKIVDDFGGEVNSEAIQQGLRNQLDVIRRETSKRFNKASELLDPLGKPDTSNFNKAINDKISEMSKGAQTGEKQKVINILEGFKNIELDNFSALRELRSDLGDQISLINKGGEQGVSSKGAAQLMSVKSVLEEDLEKFASNVRSLEGGEAGFKAFREANEFFRNRKLPFKKREIQRMLDTDEPEIITNFLRADAVRGGRGSRANKLFNVLDKEGKKAVKASLISDAFGKASSDTGFSAAKFSSELDKIENITNVFFSKPEQKTIDGLKKVFRATQGAASAGTDPATGARLVLPATIAGTATISPSTAAISSLGVGAIKILTQNKTAVKLLNELSRDVPVQREARILDMLGNIVSRSLIVEQQDEARKQLEALR